MHMHFQSRVFGILKSLYYPHQAESLCVPRVGFLILDRGVKNEFYSGIDIKSTISN